jgi:hypothetical protein
MTEFHPGLINTRISNFSQFHLHHNLTYIYLNHIILVYKPSVIPTALIIPPPRFVHVIHIPNSYDFKFEIFAEEMEVAGIHEIMTG